MYLELAQISKPFILSIKTIGVSAILFMIIGVPIAFILSKKNLRFKWILDTIVTMPLIFPPIAVVFFSLYS